MNKRFLNIAKTLGHGLIGVAGTLLVAFATGACSTIDCPLNSRVYTNYTLAGDLTKLNDTLTIATVRHEGSDSVLINRQTGTQKFILPISYQAQADVFYFERRGAGGYHTLDTVTIRKEDHPHFESVDCNPSFFHTLKAAETTRHGIDSIVIKYSTVNYDTTKEHLYIYFKSNIY